MYHLINDHELMKKQTFWTYEQRIKIEGGAGMALKECMKISHTNLLTNTKETKDGI